MTNPSLDFDIAVVGAGIAGLTCAQQLQQAGYRVVILEKSRGVGGRLATRRLHETLADHGTCYLTPKGEAFRGLLEQLVTAGGVQSWTDTVHELSLAGTLSESSATDRYPRYVAPHGMTAIAKWLATALDIRLNHLVQSLALVNDHWQLTIQRTEPDRTKTTETLTVGAIVLTIPAPQATVLLQTLSAAVLPEAFLEQVQGVAFLPCLSVIAGYESERQQDWLSQYPDVRSLSFVKDGNLAWLGLDSSKRSLPSQSGLPQPVFVVQSTAAFAEQYLDAIDLQPAGYQLLKQASERLVPWLAKPDWLQVHRWRYAVPMLPRTELYLAAKTRAPLFCAGDWCGGMKAEQAFLSGLAVSEHLNHQLQN
ncbi:NAD(P)/FAD-dependent oxidoreductase [Stenomitos frigidus]|uniref:FAD-dependent oxidoreductase n=1 Tax=Stenomitos frigidus ULC18 TaxID=2107698 RepID=A0A2T1EGM9_9CYAN|nr:FAD-dependent oxidoreductase [Stenomitos frigidus]PSB31845.1 FAD-dependent oxidoreductase [Stenomitos frigidus ULC18]